MLQHFDFDNRTQKSFFWRLWLAFGCGGLCGLFVVFKLTLPLDRLFYDSASQLFPDQAPNDIVIVAIDERSLLEFGRWPWAREKHVQLIRLLSKVNVKAVAIDVIFSEPDVEYPEVDQLLAQAIAENGKVLLPVFMGQTHRGGQLFEVKPLPSLADASRALGHVHIELDSDGIARSVFLQEGLGAPNWKHFSVALLELLEGPIAHLPGAVNHDVLSQPSAISIIRSHKNYFPLRQIGSFETVSYVDVLSGRIPAAALANKIIFIGATAPGLGDNVTTSLGQLSGVEFNANIFDALRNDRLVQVAATWQLALISLLLVALILWFISRLEPKQFLLATIAVIGLVIATSFVVLVSAHYWITPVPIVAALIVAYPLWNWWRLEKAMGYLRNQLADMKAQQANDQSLPVVDQATKSLDFLHALGAINAWQISQSSKDKKVVGNVSEDAYELEWNNDAKGWQHNNRFSRCQLTAAEHTILLVEWNDAGDYSRDILQQALPMHSPQSSQQSLVGRELFQNEVVESEVVEETIRQLSLADQQAQAQRQMVEDSLSQLSSAVLLATFDGKCLFANEQAHRLLKHETKNDSLLNYLERVTLPSPHSWPTILRELVFNGIPFSCEGVIDSDARDVLCHGSLVSSPAPLMLFNIVDISDLKRSQRNQVDALNFVSHDLRAPLTSVLALIEGARTEHPNQVNRELLENIEQYVRRNLSYSENYIHLAKLEATGATRRDECEAHSLIDNAIAQIFHYAKAKQITLKSPEYSQEYWLNCDRGLVERALVNLIDNAIKFSEQQTKIVIDLAQKQGKIVFSVIDQGLGISSSDLNNLFERFQQSSHKGHLAAGSGVGLGLKFVAEVAAAHEGQVDVKSTPGEGTTFLLSLPGGE